MSLDKTKSPPDEPMDALTRFSDEQGVWERIKELRELSQYAEHERGDRFNPLFASTADMLEALLRQSIDRVMVAHGEGAETTLHPADRPCAKCRPPIAITDAMIDRFNKTWSRLHWQGVKHANVSRAEQVRAALEAALNG